MRGTIVQIAARGARALVGIGTVAVLSRLLTPAEFGLFALIFFVTSFAQVIGDFGVHAALVVRKDPSPIEYHSMFWLSVGIGLALTIGTIIAAEPIAAAFGDAGMAGPLRTAAWVFVLASIRSVPMAILDKAFRFQTLAVADVVGAVAGAAAAVGFAFAGQGVLALVVQQLVSTAIPSLMNLASSQYRPELRFSYGEVRPLMGYGVRVMLSGMITYLATSIDRPIVGSRLSATDLGYLSVSQQIVATPIRTIVWNLRRVTFPIMASIQDDNARIAAAHARSLHALMLVLAPICLGLAAVGVPAARLLLGPGWDMAGQIIGIAAISVLINSIAEANSAIFGSKGQADFLLKWSIFGLIGNTLLLLLSVPFGLIAVAAARLTYVLLAVPLSCWFLSRLLGCRPSDLVLPLMRPLAAAAVMAVLVALLDSQVAQQLDSPLLRLVVLVPFGCVCFAGLLWLFDQNGARAFLGQVNSLRAR